MIVRGYGKINLSLDVVRRREDGYHDLRMIMQSVDIYDELTLLLTDTDCITMTCSVPGLPTDDSNLVVKAAKTLLLHCGITRGLNIHLKKNIPLAAGMAGGSADAAAVLVGLNKMLDLQLSIDELKIMGVTLGADIPFCIQGGTCLSEGIGDVLTVLPSPPDCDVLIIKPSFDVSTKFVYGSLQLTPLTVHPDVDGMIDYIIKGDLNGICQLTGNVLASVTEAVHSQIIDIRCFCIDSGALTSLMTGSGPTVFALFNDSQKALFCKEEIIRNFNCESAKLTKFKDCGVEIIY